ncbi:FadR/GntR family transcriptional regulator [Brevibacillus thermoruber]|jgi:GntR family transcriptional regulator, transcriptional repressor for pyruvate dehydrogenase complex|uniref:FadR/GntR family transcriptional regulator n=1 Tax=Brevibacillus thermoruber TaxID=33942 RepID=A0A9X3TP92_9BACL|nr:FadR/GntR family transcriptional regulator [Brevibacillus thermoruber]MDA5107949.1 FadR/GntR family transcriptional regulator [Brevibacillus thermoruber]
MEAAKIDSQKISDRVALQIEQWITAGHVRPGDKLPSVRELCQLFDVGRTAVRDAITTLKGKGMVEVRHGNGTFVCQFDCSRVFQGVSLVRKEDIRNLFAVRKILEAGTAELAAVHRETDHLNRMKEALERLAQADTLEGWRADLDFHLAIAEATQNEHLVQLMQTVSSAIRKGIMDCHRIILADAEQERTIFQQHVAVFEAIRDAEPDQARQAMVEHLAHVEALLNGTL